jgi:Class II Aldolase and Adducin N-terminal domain
MKRLVGAGILAVALLIAASGHPAAAQTPPASGGPVDPALIEDLVAANRILAEEGVLDAYGHVSIRHPGNPDRYLMSRSLAPILVTAGDIIEYDLDSNPIDPKDRRSVLERFIHGEIYKARPDANAVIHSHSPAVVPFGVTQVPMRPVIHVAAFLWVGVPVWDIRDTGDPSSAALLVRNGPLGKSLAARLGRAPGSCGKRKRSENRRVETGSLEVLDRHKARFPGASRRRSRAARSIPTDLAKELFPTFG